MLVWDSSDVTHTYSKPYKKTLLVLYLTNALSLSVDGNGDDAGDRYEKESVE